MQLKTKIWARLSREEKDRILKRSEAIVHSLLNDVESIIDAVRKTGDAALLELSTRFDGVDLSIKGLRVQAEEFEYAQKNLSIEVREALAFAVENVTRFHELQRHQGLHFKETSPGVYAGERATPIPSAGLYVPRGKGSFPSMLYMLAVPARLAGVPRVCVTTPPNPDGSVDPACLYAAKLCGVTEIYRVGGAQAVAALALGTESISPVDKIVGPGSPYVAAAKRLLSGEVDTGLPAGPSESIIIADGSADPWKVALDLTVEAEHGADSSAILVTDSRQLAEAVSRFLSDLIAGLPEPRKEYVESVLSNFGGILIAGNMKEACEIVNEYAPEHLQIQTEDPWDTLSDITNAGEILLGENLPFSVANYAAGPNAVLPTGGKARTWSPVSVRDFMKYSSVIYATAAGLEGVSAAVTSLADYEGFPAHSRALKRRKER
ncbi:MAG: histidinol dehydrogenase [Spirochaetales bacterium]|nr:histidinol dehydrogenase [Spirochaetales bacterium]